MLKITSLYYIFQEMVAQGIALSSLEYQIVSIWGLSHAPDHRYLRYK